MRRLTHLFQLFLLSLAVLFVSYGAVPKPILATTFQLSGRVLQASGTGIASAIIDAVDPATSSVITTTSSDSGGNYSLFLAGGTYNIQVTAPTGSGLGSAVSLNRSIASDTVINFVLVSSGVSLSGQVYDALGNPVPNQRVFVNAGNNQAGEAITDAVGAYALTLSAGTYSSFGVGGRNNPASLNVPPNYDIVVFNFSINQSTVLDLTVPVKRVDVRVQDGLGGPISAASVQASVINPINDQLSIGGGITNARGVIYTPYTRKTNASGGTTFWLFPNAGNAYSLTATPPAGSPYGSATVNIVVVEDFQQTITLPSAVSLSGHVYDPLGNPVPNQRVSLGNTADVVAQTTTNASGAYSLLVSPGTYFTIAVRSPEPVTISGGNSSSLNIPQNYSLVSFNYTINQNTIQDFTIPAKRVDVHVVNTEANPIDGVRVTARGNPTNLISDNLDMGGGLVGRGNLFDYERQTNSSGDAVLWLFPNQSNSYDLSGNPPSGGLYGSVTTNIVVAGDMQQTITLPTPLSLSGHVYDALGNPVPNQKVFANAGNNRAGETITDAAGAYSLILSAGTYSSFGISGRQNPASLNVPADYDVIVFNFSINQSTVLDLTIPVKRVDVRVQDGLGGPISGVSVQASVLNPINDQLSIGGGITNARGLIYSPYTRQTNTSGNTTFWLFPNAGNTYSLTATPPAGSPYGSATVNIVVADDQSLLFALQFSHSQPVTVASISPPAHADGTYSNPSTITLSATAATGFTVASTSYTIDNGPLQVYSAPFTVSGTGLHTITYSSIDNAGVPETPQVLRFTIVNPPVITTAALPAITVGANYSHTLQAIDGTPPYTWSILQVGLAPGLSLSPTGVVSGIPTTAGVYNFTVQVTDNNSESATATQSITVNPPPTINTAPLPNGTVTGMYVQTLASSGGTPPLAWSLVNGFLPNGLSLSLSGLVSGTTTAAGTFSFAVQVSDVYGITSTEALSIAVNAAPVFTRNNLPNAKVGHQYSQSVTASGGTGPLVWSVSNGSLPVGLALDASAGVISGTPTTVDVYTFTVKVTDANNVDIAKQFTIQIKP